MLVFLTGMSNIKLKQHPYVLISVIALIDACYFLLFNTLDEVCVLKLYKVFAYTVYYDGSDLSQYKALVLLLKSAVTLFKSFFVISFFLNSFLSIDLYLTVKSPFVVPSTRQKFYYGISFTVGGSMGLAEAIHYNSYGHSAKFAEEITILASFLIFILIAIPATIFASRRILRKGVSVSVRRAVISRHIKYILILFLTFFLYAYKIFTEDVLNEKEPSWLDQVSIYAFASQGIWLSILRLSEPLVW